MTGWATREGQRAVSPWMGWKQGGDRTNKTELRSENYVGGFTPQRNSEVLPGTCGGAA